MTGPLSREAQQAGSLLHPLGCLCSTSQGSLGTCKRLIKHSEKLLHWEGDENSGRQSLTHLPAPGEQRSLSKGKASSSSTNCCTEFNHWHSAMPSDNQFCSQVCNCYSSEDWQQLDSSGSPLCHQPHSTWRHRSTLCAPITPGREVPCHASLPSR